MNSKKKLQHFKKNLFKIDNDNQDNKENKLMSDDPFEIFFKDYGDSEDVLQPQYTKEKLEPIEEEINTTKTKKKKLTDNDFINILKSNTLMKVSKIKCSFGICNQIKILTSEELDTVKCIRYKFPFEMDIKFEKSLIFSQVYKIFVIALKSIYKKYKEDNQEFYMKFNGFYLHFGAKLKTSKGLKKLFTVNDVDFQEVGDFLIIENKEIGLIVDLIMNFELTRSSTIPFILSENPFENSIIYTINLKKLCTVKQEEEVVSSYILYGPVWIQEYQDLLNYDNKIIW